MFSRQRRIWSFQVVVLQRTVKKCTKNYNAHAHPLFCSLNLLFGDVPVAVAVVGFLKALANEDTLLPTHCCRHKCFPVCPRAQHLLRTQNVFLILFRNILCPQQMFPSLRSPRNIMSNNVSATMCPRLPGPLNSLLCSFLVFFSCLVWLVNCLPQFQMTSKLCLRVS